MPRKSGTSKSTLCCAGAVELRNSIERHFGLDLPATLMFDYPTTAAIADYLVKKLPEAANAIAAVRPGPEECLQAFGPSTDSDLCRTQIVAISSRHPGPSLGIDGFMESMLASTDLQAQPPLGRWDNDANYTPDLLPSRMTATTRFGAFCEGLEHFDALAFRLSLAEALVVDPQTRQAAA